LAVTNFQPWTRACYSRPGSPLDVLKAWRARIEVAIKIQSFI
jgi:hypothetical protein